MGRLKYLSKNQVLAFSGWIFECGLNVWANYQSVTSAARRVKRQACGAQNVNPLGTPARQSLTARSNDG